MEQPKKFILIIEDDELNREVLKSVFEDEYEFIEAENGQEGIEKLKENEGHISAILLDILMPVMDGLTFLKEISKEGIPRVIPVFVVTADPNSNSVAEAYRLGVMDVIAKPVVPYVILRRVDSVVELFTARRELSSEVRKQQEELIEQQQKIIELNDGIIEALFVALEFRSGETGEHVRNIYGITKTLLTESELGADMDPEMIAAIATASMMHDIGKISISDAILNKPGRFTPEERKIMEEHTRLGAKFLDNIPQLKKNSVYEYAYDIALHHHERWDGRGYPDGIEGNEITPWAQAVSIADVYDALLSKRCYKEPYERAEVLRMIKDGECGTFGPVLLESFLKCEPVIFEAVYAHKGE